MPMQVSYKASRLRSQFNAFSRVMRSAYHDTIYPSIDGRRQRITLTSDAGENRYEIHEYTGKLKICPTSGLVFDDGVLLKNTSDLFMRERTPDYRTVYDSSGRHFEDLISLRHGSEPNYWHYFQLVATKPIVADVHGIPAHLPVLMSRRQFEVPFIKRSLEYGFLGDRPLIIQEAGEVISADRLYTVIPPLHGLVYRDMLLDRMGLAKGDQTAKDRWYVTRGKGADNDRRFRNEAEIVDTLSKVGFQSVDPQTLTLDEQIATFSKCGFMVSPHGAGLTNMIFRRGAPLNVLEIFNTNLVNDCYEIAARQYGFGYEALYCDNVIGKPSTGSGLVDLRTLVQAVSRALVER